MESIGAFLCTLITSSVVFASGVADFDVWWPVTGVHISGTQPFKAQLKGYDLSQYDVFWQVDNGRWSRLGDSRVDDPHKESMVDVSGWKWRHDGPYVITFSAWRGGVSVAQKSVSVYVP